MSTLEHSKGIAICTQATIGDVGIEIAAFWAAALLTRDRRWILNPSRNDLILFLAFGLAVTLVLEWLATEVLQRWSYNELMPRIPLIGTGLVPVLQWIVIPLLVVWFVRRQLT